nr:BMP family ABC transporter substrate-binding protein [Nocardioides daedukensis]
MASCGSRPSDKADDEVEKGTQYPDFKACMVSDSGGFDDKSFNQTSYAGLVNAKEKHGLKTAEVESNSDAEYDGNLKELVNADCNQITTVGFKLAAATLKSAKANPDVDYAIVDSTYIDESGKNTAPANVKGLSFKTDEAAFLAGYLGASQSKTGKVGTFGGMNIPTVTIFMNGFAKGVAKYNEDNDANVQVIGWDEAKQKGSFTNDFETQSKGQSVAKTLIRQGADVVMPVAGPAGLGGLKAVKDAGVMGIWVDTDGCVSAAEYCDVLLSSVVKAMDVAVQQAITDSAEDKFTNEVYEGTLANEGVSLAPFHEFDSKIDQKVKDELKALQEQIISGDLKVN